MAGFILLTELDERVETTRIGGTGWHEPAKAPPLPSSLQALYLPRALNAKRNFLCSAGAPAVGVEPGWKALRPDVLSHGASLKQGPAFSQMILAARREYRDVRYSVLRRA